jgi:hypothetical protein
LTFAICPWNGVSRFLQYIPDQERRKRRISFEKTRNGAGDDRCGKAGSFHVLIMGRNQLQVCDAAVDVWIPLLATDKQFVCFVGD